jgi:hypothetical protein
MRANRLRQQGREELSEESSSFTAGKAILIILLMLLLGSGGGYAYFKISTPVVHSNSITAPTAVPSGTNTPSGYMQGVGEAYG